MEVDIHDVILLVVAEKDFNGLIKFLVDAGVNVLYIGYIKGQRGHYYNILFTAEEDFFTIYEHPLSTFNLSMGRYLNGGDVPFIHILEQAGHIITIGGKRWRDYFKEEHNITHLFYGFSNNKYYELRKIDGTYIVLITDNFISSSEIEQKRFNSLEEAMTHIL